MRFTRVSKMTNSLHQIMMKGDYISPKLGLNGRKSEGEMGKLGADYRVFEFKFFKEDKRISNFLTILNGFEELSVDNMGKGCDFNT